MNGKRKNICGLCCRKSHDLEALNDVTKEILGVLFLKVDPRHDKNPMICKACSKMVQQLFKFKSQCLYTEDYIVPFLKDGGLDMADVYSDVLKNNGGNVSLPDNCKICRLCMELVEDGCVIPLWELPDERLEKNVIQEYLPEVDLKSVKDPIICTICQEALQKYYNYAMDNLGIALKSRKTINEELEEKMVKSDCSQLTKELRIVIKNLTGTNTTGRSIKDDTDSFQDVKKKREAMYECDKCLYETTNKYRLTSHKKLHSNKLKPVFKCDICHFATSFRDELKRHIPKHREGSYFKCDKCPYRCQHKALFRRHLMVHKDKNECESYKCLKCGFTTHRKDNLQNHMQTHKTASEKMTYKCTICTAVLKSKREMNRHKHMHKVESGEASVLKCPLCLYQTLRNDTLKRHMLKHKDHSEVTLYACKQCPYQANLRSSLKTHMLVHAKPEDIVMYKCDICSYQTKYKGGLRTHANTHKSMEEVETFRCYHCDYRTKIKKTLETHMVLHKDPSQVPVHKCKLCSFESKRKQEIKKHVVRKHYDELFA